MTNRSLQTIEVPSHPDSHRARQTHDEPGTLPLARLIGGVLRHRRAVLACALIGVISGAAVPPLRTETYSSESSFLLKRGGEEIDVRAFGEDTDRNVGSDVPHLLLSTDLLRRVVARLGDATTTQAGAIQSLRDRIEITVPKQSRLVHVRLESDTAESAQRTLDIFMEEAITHHLDVYSDTRSVELIRQSHVQAVSALEASQQRAQAFVDATGIVAFEAELSARQADLATALRARQTLSRDSRLENVREPRIVGMREQLRELENRGIELRARLQPGDQAIAQVERSIEELRDRMLEVAVDHAEFLREDTQRRIAEASEAVAELAPFEPRFHAIQDGLAKAQDGLARTELALERANRKQLMSQNHLSALTVLDRATEPETADGATALTLLLRGLALGLLAGVGLALMRTLTDQRVRTIEDIEQLGAPVLATIPHLTTKQIHRHQQARMIG